MGKLIITKREKLIKELRRTLEGIEARQIMLAKLIESFKYVIMYYKDKEKEEEGKEIV